MRGDDDLHREQLATIINWLVENEADWPEHRREWFKSSLAAFLDMRDVGRFPLSERQIDWVRRVAEAAEVDLPEPPPAPVPRGKEVRLLFESGKIPPKPPVRR